MNTRDEPVTFRRYALPSIKGEGWAVFVIGSDGYFSGVTDYGNAAYWWGDHGRKDFREFLLCAPRDWDYFMKKLFPHWKEYDEDETLKCVKHAIIAKRREGLCTKREARRAWEELDDYDGLYSEQSHVDWVQHAPSATAVLDWDERVDTLRHRPRYCCKHFVTNAMARLAEVLREELEQEAPPRHTHDCLSCVYLGRLGDEDLYVHADREHPVLTTVIARWGSDGPEYNSGITSQLPSLIEARRRATERGILPVPGQMGENG